MVTVVKDIPANAEEVTDMGQIPGSGRSTGGGYGNPLQYSCLENVRDRGAWQAVVCGVTESDTTEATSHTRIFKNKFLTSKNNIKQFI